MTVRLKFYTLNEYIRLNKSGDLDIEESMKMVRTLVNASSFKPRSHILVDLRETRLNSVGFEEILKIANELSKYQDIKNKKIANVIPDEVDRLHIAKNFKLALNVSGFQYDFFTEMEKAIEWLSDVQDIDMS